MSDNLEHNNISKIATDFINSTNCNVFLTGKAGTGKTTFLKNIIKNTLKKAIIIAPTGIAAINAGGTTIHSLFQLPFGIFIPDNNFKEINDNLLFNTPISLINKIKIGNKKKHLFENLELLIIDEVSMLKSDTLDAINTILKYTRNKKHLDFGGVQIVFIGDLFQLSPIIKENEWEILSKYYKSINFFDALVFKDNKPLILELNKIYRQSDYEFIEILNNFRNNNITENDINTLNKYYIKNFNNKLYDNYIYLTTHNILANKKNQENLNKINSDSFFYNAIITGEFNESSYPISKILEFKIGAQVMFIKNDKPFLGQEARFYNGKIGKIIELNSDYIVVECENPLQQIKIIPEIWNNIKYEINVKTNEIKENIIGTFEQFPLKLAWAITIHKSQGLTFDKAILDLENSFVNGQIYVALSRLTSINGLILTNPISNKLFLKDQNIEEFVTNKFSEEKIINILKKEKIEYLKQYFNDVYDFTFINNQINNLVNSFDKYFNSYQQQQIDFVLNIQKDFNKLNEIAINFIKQMSNFFTLNDNLYINKISLRVSDSLKYFSPIFIKLIKDILIYINSLENENIDIFIEKLIDINENIYKKLESLYRLNILLNTIKYQTNNYNNDEINLLKNDLKDLYKLKESNFNFNLNNKNNNLNIEDNFESIKAKKISKQTHKKNYNKKITLELLNQGKEISTISIELNLSKSTIEGYIYDFILNGQISIELFINKKVLNKIVETITELNLKNLTEMKSTFGDEISYTQLRFIKAYLNYNKF